ncbi:PEBP-like protein [Obba rivulosa]|uniref:PEBP-like protein n=1 Tax=Obba rivulosa TaxID=1052685 RepID=A0A8E2AUG4_9APHY|nr:PEBP-like protein [Obba rivulosa]
MLALRRNLPRACLRFPGVRGNADVAPSESVSSSLPPPPPPTAAPKLPPAPTKDEPAPEKSTPQARGRQRRRPWPSVRPSISLERPREWNRPLAPGVLPAYDLALEYIQEDSKNLKREVEELRGKIEAAESLPEDKQDMEALRKMRAKADILEIQSEINLPDVRWKARNGLADMNKLVYRRLIEQRWREEGALDLLMERIHQMKVVPDLLAELHPSIDLRINFPEPPPEDIYKRTRVKRKFEKVQPGVFLKPEQTWRQPFLYTTVFHLDTRLYTLLMVDLDAPDPANQTFQTYLHWMQPNIALNTFSPSPIPLTTTHTRWIPPHPQRGTPYHRYALVLLPQAHPTERISVPVPTDEERLGFDVRAFCERYGLDGSKGGGAHMWREVWDETVSKIYRDVLKTEEPRYGRPPKGDPYAQIKSTPKYL